MNISSSSISAPLAQAPANARDLADTRAGGARLSGATQTILDRITISQEGADAYVALSVLQAITGDEGGTLALANGTRAETSGGVFRIMAGFSDTKDGPQRSYIDIAGSEAAETVEVELRPGRPSPVGAEASGGTAQVLGGGGDDTITLVATGTAGQAGVDTGYWLAANVGGGSGDDRISFTGGIATSIKVYGDAGNDTLIGTGADRVDGGAGDDVIEARQTRIVVGGTGNDRITVGQGTLVQMVRDNGTDVVEFDASALASGGRGDAGLTIWVQDLLSNIDEFESRIAVRRDGADFVLTAWDGGSIRIKDAAEAAWSVGIDAGIIGGQRAGARIVAADTPSGARLSFSV